MLRMGKFEKSKLFENWIRKFIFKVKRKELGRMTRGPKLAMQKMDVQSIHKWKKMGLEIFSENLMETALTSSLLHTVCLVSPDPS